MDSKPDPRVSVPFAPETLDALRKAGSRQHRSRTRQIVHYVEEGLRRDGLLDTRAAS